MKRKTPLKRSRKALEARGVAKPSKVPSKASKARKKARFERQFHSESYVRFVQGLPCACGCNRGPCEVSHDPSRGAGGTWTSTHPLHPECHRELHRGAETFWLSRNLTREDANARTQALWLIHES